MSVTPTMEYQHVNADVISQMISGKRAQLEQEHYGHTLNLALLQATPVVVASLPQASEEDLARAQADAQRQHDLQVETIKQNLSVLESQLTRLNSASA